MQGDLISRDAVLDILKDKWDLYVYADDAMQASIDKIRVLPSVTPTDISVIEDIKTEIMALEPQYPIDDNTPYISSQSVWKIVNKHCGGENE